MSRQVPRNKALSDEDRAYLLGHGEDILVAQLDEQFGAVVDEDSDPYEEWSAEDLRTELGERGLAKSGSKAEMAARLREDDADKG